MDNETEVWKSHPEIVGVEVSSFGNIRVLDRVVSNEHGTWFIEGRVLNQRDNGKGYLLVNIPIDGNKVVKLVHRLVAQTYIQNPDNLPMVNHKDCDRTNNHVENLEFCTPKYNSQYREKYGKAQKKPVFAINLTTLEVSHFKLHNEASRVLGTSDSGISSVIKGRLNQTNGFWFVNADDKAVDLTKQKLREIGKTKLTATDSASADFVSKIISE